MLTASFSLDFTAASLDGRVTFTRATGVSNPTTYTNSIGFITAATNDEPRFDYDPVTLICKGLLIEDARANLLNNSNDFQNGTYWTKTRSTISDNSIVSPDGTQNADKLVETATTGTHTCYNVTTVSLTAQPYTWSVYMKAGERTWGAINAFDGANRVSYFDLANGVTGNNASGNTSTITNVGNGWYRCTVTRTASVTASGQIEITAATANGTNSYAGDITKGIYIWGAQLEAGASATSYIPTTTTSLTRNADVATITGTAFSGLWRSGPGSILVRALPSTVSGTRPLVQVDDATADNIIALRGNTTNPELYIRAGGSDQATIDAGTISAAAYRLAGAWKAGNGVATLNGFAPVKGTPASIPAATQMRLGSDGTNYLNGHFQSLEYWDEFLTPATLQSVTTSAGYRSIVGPVMRDTIIA